MFVPDRHSLPIDSNSLEDPGNALVAISSPEISDEMSSWGTLINPDKSPAPLLEQLCLGIAQLLPTFDSNGTNDLTPDRVASFYRKVGGNYDPLFLGTKSTALSFIYQSLGCFHSLQPSSNPYEPPSVPSLQPAGFVRWQTIQLLMEPDEHWQYLRNAVSMWDIADANGELFPKEIPRDAFPPSQTQRCYSGMREIHYQMKKSASRIRRDSQHSEIIATMSQIELVGGVSTTDASAPSILHSMPVDRNQASPLDQMEFGLVFRLLEVLRHLHENILIIALEIMNSQPGIPTTRFPRKWTSLQSQNPSPMIQYMKKNRNPSLKPNPDVGPDVIYPHRIHVHAVTPTMHTHGNPFVISHPPRHEETIEDTTTRSPSPTQKQENQTQTEHPDPIITTTVLAPDHQALNSKNSYSTSLTQLQPQPQSQTQQCTCPHHHGHPLVTDTI
ncbi:hypothetical protein N7494_008523 [Penicillium frequentans]|uniref:DUF7514 domain-containing protein n=1 Tax=Penicillium frequentans TaxID=3151616 RepID=A0AAD6CN23_9EURO|nr:hypothetical protein N7494_008523 [Penicillium glabrum]